MDDDWTHPVAHANEDVPKDHTPVKDATGHIGHGCSEDPTAGPPISRGEYTRMMCIIGVLVDRLIQIADESDPEKGHKHFVEIYDEELINMASTKMLQMGVDPAKRCVTLRVEG